MGCHPFSGWKRHELTDTERSLMLRDRFRHIVRVDPICGMHVHVAVPDAFDRIALLDIVRAYTPHLLALSCSSPFHAGEETGYSSYRTISWRRFPLSGVSPHFASAEEYRAFMDMLLRSGFIPDERTVYWSVRSSPRYPTLELRTCDVCPRIADAVAISALGRAMVVAAAENLLTPLGASLSAPLSDIVLTENEWIAARDGLDGVLVAPERSDARMPLREAIAELVETVRPIAESLGDAEALDGIATILEQGNAADRLRAQAEVLGGDLRALVLWAVEETRTGSGMDRRTIARSS
jgi:carboxylate-amine ligase